MKTVFNNIINWSGIEVSITFTHNYFEPSNISHIEVKANQPLPITQTGYRSIFITDKVDLDFDFESEVLDYLNEAAKDTDWLAYLKFQKQKIQDSKQLTLF